MDLTPEPPSNVVALNGSVESQLEIMRAARKNEHECRGRHKRITVDSELRTLTCRDCGYIVDPYEYIEQWALEGERRMEELKNIEIQIRVFNAERYDLEKKVKNLRQKLNRAGDPQPQNERREFDAMRWNPNNKELMEKLRIIEGGKRA